MRQVFMFTLTVAFLFSCQLPLLAQCSVPGGCPLPKTFKIKGDGTPEKNSISMDAAFKDSKYGDIMEATTIDSDVSIMMDDSPNFEIKENEEELSIDFEIPKFAIDAWAAGATDCDTKHTEDEHKWSPNDDYHAEKDDQFPFKQFSCWEFKIDKSYWTGATVWKIEKAAHAYHFDGPTKYGVKGGIGDNGNEEGYSDEKGKKPDPMTYNVPSVPYYYFVSSGMTARWTWDHSQNIHYWAHSGFKDVLKNGTTYTIPDQKCDMCWQKKDDIEWPHPQVKKEKMTDIPPEDFYENDAVQHVPDEPEEGYDSKGVAGPIYDEEQGLEFKLPKQGTVITRAHCRVLDTKRIANVSFGDGSKCEWAAIVGRKVSEFEPTSIQFALYDNAPHMRLTPIFEDGLKKQGDDFDIANMKVIFWYEDVVYDYLGFNNPALGLGEVFYAPKFLLKQGRVWEEESDLEENFFKKGTTDPMRDGNSEDTGHNPQYVEYDLEFQTSDLFSGKGGDDSPEDAITWHYAMTSLGDQFGNPRWETDAYDGEPFNDYYGLATKFKNKPLNMKDGRGALKCFFEVTQCSKTDDSQGGGDPKFLCDNNYFFNNLSKNESKYQEQVVYNPEKVPYIQKPDKTIVEGGSEVTPSKPGTDVESQKYDDVADNWRGKAKMKNGASVEKFQAWGKIFIEDDRLPNVGLRVYNKSSRKYRNIYRLNSVDKMSFYESLRGGGTKSLERNDDEGTPDQYQDQDERWEFTALPDDVGQGEDLSDQGYGCFEDVDLELSHQDLKNNTKDGSVLCFYAHDNIDGQRIKNARQIEKYDFYKGVECNGSMREQYPSNMADEVFANKAIGKGYKSWLIFDNTYSEPKMLEYYRPDGNNFVYPNVSFHNPNVKGDGSELNPGASDIHVSYKVEDRAGNARQFRLNFFVKAIDVNINTLERHDRRYDNDDE